MSEIDKDAVKMALTALLTSIADKAKSDAATGESDIGSIFKRDTASLKTMDLKILKETIDNIESATRTQEGVRSLMNGIMIAAKIAAKIA